MPKAKRVKPHVGKGVNKETMRNVKASDAPKLITFQITDDAWAAFYASPEGKARLRRMQALNNMMINRYQGIVNGQGLTVKKSDVRQRWKALPFDQNGNIQQRNQPLQRPRGGGGGLQPVPAVPLPGPGPVNILNPGEVPIEEELV
jgi:hypothetical protein